MCRFVVYRGTEVSLRTLVYGGSHSLVEQAWAPRELLSGHTNADGYGICWRHGGRLVRIARREPIWYDPDLEQLLEILSADEVVAILRNATHGMSVGAGGLAPLILDEWSFVLNGYVNAFHDSAKRELHRRLPDDLYRELKDGSDTETLFLTALHAVRDGAGPGDALRHVIRLVGELTAGEDQAQLNMVLSGPESTAVTRASTVPPSNSLYWAREPEMAPGGVVVASERLDGGDGWTEVPDPCLLEIEGGGEVRLTPLPV